MSENGALALMRAIRDAEIAPPNRKLVLLMLATYANCEGAGIRPSLETVARLSGLDVRSVRRHVRACRDRGWLVQTEPSRQHRPAEYRISLAALRPDTSVRPGAAPDRTPESALGSDRTPVSARPDSGVPQTGHQSPGICTDLNRPGAPTASPANGQAVGALPASVRGSWRHGVTVAAEGGKVEVSVPTEYARGFLALNHRHEIAAHYGVDPDAVEFV